MMMIIMMIMISSWLYNVIIFKDKFNPMILYV